MRLREFGAGLAEWKGTSQPSLDQVEQRSRIDFQAGQLFRLQDPGNDPRHARSIEQGRLPVPPTDTVCDHDPDKSSDHAEKSTLLGLRIAQRSVGIQHRNLGTKIPVHMLPVQAGVNQADKGHLGIGHGVADRRRAARRVPAQHALVAEPHCRQKLLALQEAQVLLRYLDYLGSALLIQHSRGIAKETRKSTAIRAMADKAVVGVVAVKLGFNGAAPALNRMHCCHPSLEKSAHGAVAVG